ncbi:MAG: MarR family transcriptional regulator [Lachnospiraceae bacterium]|nr:MarR family transcriptional regulator [Lachnospiraceae bacterium]
MIEEAFVQVYTKFKLNFYKSVFEKIQKRETSLTTVETYCIEIIHAMGTPTIGEFASFIQISSPNAAYKVNSLIKKGYLKKVQSEDDKREYYLEVTDKYYDYYNMNAVYLQKVAARMKERFTEEELAVLEKVLTVMSSELMPEVENIKQTLISVEK